MNNYASVPTAELQVLARFAAGLIKHSSGCYDGPLDEADHLEGSDI